METGAGAEELLRSLAPKVLGVLVRRYGNFGECEDAVQEALLAAAVQWLDEGVPERPLGWLITVASRRMTDYFRSEAARRHREAASVDLQPADLQWVPGPEADRAPEQDDTLTLLFMCCHPALSPVAQAALTLRAVGGLTTEQIAGAWLTPEPTMRRRISRAKRRIKESGAAFQLPTEEDWPARLRVVLHVLYLIFNEGYATTSGPEAQRGDLTAEAIRLAREIHKLRPADGEVAALLALMLLVDARRAARTQPDGTPVPLDEQDRGKWDRAMIGQGVALLARALAAGPAGPYHVQAAIAAVHAEAAHAQDTDWPQILGLYDVLQRVTPSPVVALNRAVAVAMVHGPRVALVLLSSLEADARLAGYRRLDAVRAHMLEMAGDVAAARFYYHQAARQTASTPERRYLEGRAAALAVGD